MEPHGNRTMFTAEEVGNFMMVRKLELNYIEIGCGCTVRRFGDSFGNLRAYVDGRIEIDCCCVFNCQKAKLSPIQFISHLGKNTNVDTWKKQIWVMDKDGTKIKLTETCLLRYHVQLFQLSLRHRVHRDEFIRCSKCNKERRFQLHGQEQYRAYWLYHRASLNRDWQCSDTPEIGMTCDDVEERQSRRPCRGCPKTPKCSGCLRCVCTGCSMCRFKDCNCQICTDYLLNVWHAGNNQS